MGKGGRERGRGRGIEVKYYTLACREASASCVVP